MECKHCGASLPEENGLCPACGKQQDTEEEIVIALDAVPEAEEEIIIAPDAAPEAETAAEDLGLSNQNLAKTKRIAAISGCIAGLAVLATVLFFGIRGGWDLASLLKPRENNVQYKESYSVSNEEAMEKADVVVATMPGAELTNRQLQMFYWMQVYDFIDYYGYYLSYMGMDYTAPLDEQPYDDNMTWQQYFLDAAIDNWRTYTALTLAAEKNGFKMGEEYQTILDSLEEEMTATAIKGGYASADELLDKEMGAGCTFQDYYDYLYRYYTGYSYFSHLYSQVTPTSVEIEAYFEKNAESFAQNQITKDSGKLVDIRHILVKIEETNPNPSEEEQGDYGYSKKAWTACMKDAQTILDTWLAGDKTEESFGKLANEHSDDQNGNVTNGGIYEDVTKGQMVAPFDAWIFDESRVPGDYGLVQTQFGYHVMYFVGSTDIWYAEAEKGWMQERSAAILTEVLDQYEINTNFKKIALAVVEMGQ